MKNSKSQLALGLVLALSLLGGVATPMLSADALSIRRASDSTIDNESNQALQDFQTKIKGSSKVLSEAKGVLVFPHIYQGGLVVGAEYGKGTLYIGGQPVAHYRLTEGSVGLQIGGQRKAYIMAFMTDSALNHSGTALISKSARMLLPLFSKLATMRPWTPKRCKNPSWRFLLTNAV